jgi:hypothetical protein
MIFSSRKGRARAARSGKSRVKTKRGKRCSFGLNILLVAVQVEPAKWHDDYDHHGGDRLAGAFGAKTDGERIYRVMDSGAESQAP